MFDIDGSGKIDMVELGQILQGENHKYKCSKEEIQSYIVQFDTNGDGMIDFEEFKLMMKTYSKI